MAHDADERAFRVSAECSVLGVSAQERMFGVAAQEFADFSEAAPVETYYVITAGGYVTIAGGRVTHG